MDTAKHHQFTIDRTNADDALDAMRRFADNARSHGDREGAARLDLVVEDLRACIAAGWRDRRGIPVARWEYHLWVNSMANGLCSVRIQLRPIRLAA